MGSTADWREVMSALEDRTFCIAMDLPGHGSSLSLTPEAYTVEGAAEAVIDTLDELEVERPVIVGYSMGGRLALYLALRYPERCAGLFLESASPGLESAGERAARREADEERAKRLESGNFEEFLEDWHRQPLFASMARDRNLLRRTIELRRRNDPGELERLDVPTLAVAGGLDGKYAGISSRMASLSPWIESVVAPEAGHTVHAEIPAVYISLLD